jgi:hypothetical protein
MEVRCQLQGVAILPRQEEPRYPLDRRLGGLQTRPGRCGEEQNLFTVLRIEP